MYLVDLPGYGYARAPRSEREGWEKLVTSYLLDREPLRFCVFLVDSRHDVTERDLTLKTWLDHYDLPYVVAATKTDKLGRAETRTRTRGLERGLERPVVPVSARTGSGIPELEKTIRAAAAPDARN
jgi:GTP-binding protein